MLEMQKSIIKIIFLSIIFISARAGHWEDWMVYKRECGTLEKRCVADSPNEIIPVCEISSIACGERKVYSTWEEAVTNIGNVIHLKIGNEEKKVPVTISLDGKIYLIFQRRLNGELDFYRKWDDYVDGFGNAEGEYWIGLRALNALTSTGKFHMTVFLESFNSTQVFARYGTFEVNGPETFYKLNIADYSGTAGDAMGALNNMMFSTQDQDHDAYADGNCAVTYHGAWWYGACHACNLNGKYFPAPGNHTSFANGMNWQPFMGYHVSMKKTIMALFLK